LSPGNSVVVGTSTVTCAGSGNTGGNSCFEKLCGEVCTEWQSGNVWCRRWTMQCGTYACGTCREVANKCLLYVQGHGCDRWGQGVECN
jgi:hypothetical protein